MGFNVRLILFFRCDLLLTRDLDVCNRQKTPPDILLLDGTSELDNNITIQKPNGPKPSGNENIENIGVFV